MSSNTSNGNEATPFGQAALALADKVDNNKQNWGNLTNAQKNALVADEINVIKTGFKRGGLDVIMREAKKTGKVSGFNKKDGGYDKMKASGSGLNASQVFHVAEQAYILKMTGHTNAILAMQHEQKAQNIEVVDETSAGIEIVDESNDDPLLAMMAEPQTDATVEADYISWERIQNIFNNPQARMQAVNTCYMAYTADANLDRDGNRCTFYNGKSKNRTGAKVIDMRTFIHKVLGMSWFNLAGIASIRGDDLASNNVLKVANGQSAYNTNVLYSSIYAIVAVEAGVKKFNHDLRKYISDETIENIRNIAIDTSDLSHAKAPSNGWNLPYQRGDANTTGERMSLDDLLGSNFTL